MVDRIAPTLKNLGTGFDRLTPQMRAVMPQYQIMDAQQWLQTLTQLDKDWAMVLKGKATKDSVKVDQRNTETAILSAKASANLFNSSLQIAEASITCSSAEDLGKTPKKKKTKKAKK